MGEGEVGLRVGGKREVDVRGREIGKVSEDGKEWE